MSDQEMTSRKNTALVVPNHSLCAYSQAPITE